jgi:hypothetical protein
VITFGAREGLRLTVVGLIVFGVWV